MKTRKLLSILLALMLTLGLFAAMPTMVYADSGTCVIDGEDLAPPYSDLSNACAYTPPDGTVRLTSDFLSTNTLSPSNKNLTLNLNGHSLTIEGQDSKLGANGSNVLVTNGNVVLRKSGRLVAQTGGVLTVYGNITSERLPLDCSSAGSEITINGDVTSGGNGVSVVGGGTVTIDGTLTLPGTATVVVMGNGPTLMTLADAVSDAGYLKFSDGTNTVRVKNVVLQGTAPSIGGPASMTVAQGYAATSTGAFTVTGTPAPTMTKISGDPKITWNDLSKKLDIAAGLAVGSYPVVLKATNAIAPDVTFTFTLTVSKPKYALAVTGGRGGGSYEASTQVFITANDPQIGYVFDKWTSTGGGTFANANSASTTFTMPANAATVIANYKLGGEAIDNPVPTKAQFTYDLTSKIYNGKEQGVTVTQKSDVGKVTAIYYTGTNGTISKKSKSKPKNIGSYAVTIDASAGTKYNAVKNLALGSFKIIPSKTSISKIAVAKKQMKVTWKNVSTAQKITKYEVRYRVKGTPTWKTKSYAASKSSATVKSLTKGKKYEVQVRSYKTVSKVKYYSAWSATKTSGKIK